MSKSKIDRISRSINLLEQHVRWEISPDLQKYLDEIIDNLKSVKSDLSRVNKNVNIEWYTPLDIIQTVRRVIGRINLDPASSEVAQQNVKADKYFSKECNGLNQFWQGNVFCNPPYGANTKHFMDKCVSSSYVNHAIFLVNRTGAAWYLDRLAGDYWSVICRVRKRIAFLDQNGVVQTSPRYYNDILYHGPYIELFCNEFKKYGECQIRGKSQKFPIKEGYPKFS